MKTRVFAAAGFAGVLVALCAVLWAPAASAQTGSAGAAEVVTVDVAAVFDKLDEKSAREAELDEFRQARLDELNSLQQRLQALTSELEVLPEGEPERDAKFEEAVRLQATLNFEEEFAQRRVAQKQQQLQLRLFNKIVDAVGRYAEREGHRLVIHDDSGVDIPENIPPQQFQTAIATRRVIFASPSIDITDAVAVMMNNEY